MLTLYHAPNSRSSRIITLLIALGKLDQCEIRLTDIPRQSGVGARDPKNPHPEGKVPLLVTEEGEEIRESNAIMLYLTDRFPTDLAPAVGAAGRGRYLSWMFWYGNVLEPVFVHQMAELTHPALTATFRGVPEALSCLSEGLTGQDYILGDRFSAADLLLASPFLWFPAFTPDIPVIRDWLARCSGQAALLEAQAYDEEAMKALGLVPA